MGRKKIIAPRGKLMEVVKLFNTTPQTVSSAVNFVTHSKFSDKIRAAVIERGGQIFEYNKEK